MSLGFESAGFKIEASIDSNLLHLQTYSTNFPYSKTICRDLSNISGDEIRTLTDLGNKHIHMIFGGPPCQGFSLIGKRSRLDNRNKSLLDFARLVGELRPSYFVVENVEGLLWGHAREFLLSFLHQVEKTGYRVVEPIQVLDASNFGVPQRRRRILILGYKNNLPAPNYPSSHCNKDKNHNNSPNVWDAIGDLPNVDLFEELFECDSYYGELNNTPSAYASIMREERLDPENMSLIDPKNGKGLTGCLRTKHTPETVKRFEMTKPGTHEPISRFFRLSKYGHSNTLRAGTGPSNGSFTAPRPIHPIFPRCITVREAARLHSFSDWFQFHPTKWHGFRQIGNSVPPLLARAVAKEFMNLIRGN